MDQGELGAALVRRTPGTGTTWGRRPWRGCRRAELGEESGRGESSGELNGGARGRAGGVDRAEAVLVATHGRQAAGRRRPTRDS